MGLEGRERSAGRTRAPDRPDRSVRQGRGRTNPPPPRRAAAPARAQRQPQYQQPQYQEPVEDDELPPAGPPRGYSVPIFSGSRAVQETPPPLPYEEPEEYPSRNYQAQEYPSTVHPLHRYAAQAGAHQGDDQERLIRSGLIRRRRKSRPIRRAMTTRCMARLNPARRISSASRPIPTIPTPIRTATTRSRKSSARSAVAACSRSQPCSRWR